MIAIIASATGTALIPTQGSCLPFVLILIASLFKLIEFFSVKIELVGFTTNLAIIGCPDDIPPNIPPE